MSRFDPFAGAGPRWWSIEAHRPFLEDLAAGVLDWLGEDAPETLSDAVILLPNRRAVRALGEAFLLAGDGKPMLLPRVAAIGDVDEDELVLTGSAASLDAEPFRPQLAARGRVMQAPLRIFQS